MDWNRQPFFGWEPPLFSSQIAQVVALGVAKLYHLDKEDSLPLTYTESYLHKGLQLIIQGNGNPVGNGLVVGSVRMGYGHHRMAYSIYSHSLEKKIPTYLHDLLAIESPEAKAIADVDGLYSYFSRLSSEMGGPMEWVWGNITNSGNQTSLYLSILLAKQYKRLMENLPKENPVITTYPLNGQIAYEAGFSKIIHLVCDNHPQYYLLVPGALNLVQTESNYKGFIHMGVPKENLAVAGHWVSHEIRENAIQDSELRMYRLENKQPLVFLIPVGGAGAQKSYLSDLVTLAKDFLRAREIFFLINTGDHEHVFEHLKNGLEKNQIPYGTIRSWKELLEFQKEYLVEKNPPELPFSVMLFHFSSHTEAFTATDYLIRTADVLVTKPSELAFYPVPKLFIRRVGDHEEKSALYSLELGEGTVECREPEHAMDLIHIFQKNKDILIRMNECVIKNSEKGLYSGSQKAVEIAMDKI